jgi:hypothetical protein
VKKVHQHQVDEAMIPSPRGRRDSTGKWLSFRRNPFHKRDGKNLQRYS